MEAIQNKWRKSFIAYKLELHISYDGGDFAEIRGVEFYGYLKGKSGLILYRKFPELKFKCCNREFWCRGYYVDTAGENDKKSAGYIRRQWEEGQAGKQLTMESF